ncbi:MAG: hypothetical protein PHU71_03555 [Candidatus Gracilibacteria bacterium]|nr:hypothetical protein [Candidatus Gracilibacteria bacterium]
MGNRLTSSYGCGGGIATPRSSSQDEVPVKEPILHVTPHEPNFPHAETELESRMKESVGIPDGYAVKRLVLRSSKKRSLLDVYFEGVIKAEDIHNLRSLVAERIRNILKIPEMNVIIKSDPDSFLGSVNNIKIEKTSF